MSSGWKRLASSSRWARAFSDASPAEDHLAQARVLPQVERRLARRQRAEPHAMARCPRQGGEGPAAGDQHPRGRADQLRREPGEAAVPGRVLAGPERLGSRAGFGLRLEVGLEVVQHEQDRLVAQARTRLRVRRSSRSWPVKSPSAARWMASARCSSTWSWYLPSSA